MPCGTKRFALALWDLSLEYFNSFLVHSFLSLPSQANASHYFRFEIICYKLLLSQWEHAIQHLGFWASFFFIFLSTSCWISSGLGHVGTHMHSLRASDWRPWKMGFGIISAGLAYFPLLFLCLTFTQHIVIHDAIGHLSPFCSISDYCFDFPSGVSRVFCLSVRQRPSGQSVRPRGSHTSVG